MLSASVFLLHANSHDRQKLLTLSLAKTMSHSNPQ